MTLNFLSSADGNPVKRLIKIAPQTTRGVPPLEAAYTDVRDFGGQFTLSPGSIDPQRLNSSTAPLPKLIGKIGLNPGSFQTGDLDPGSNLFQNLLASLYDKATVSNPTAGVTRRVFGSGEATAQAPYVSVRVDDNVNPRSRWIDVCPSGMTVTAQPNQNLSVEFPLVAGAIDYHGAVTQEVGSGSTKPHLLRTWSGNWEASADKNIWIKVTTAPSLGVVGFKVKVSAAETYDGAEILYTLGDLPGKRLTDQDGARIGIVPEQVLLYWPAGATLSLNDEFKVANRMAVWAPSYATDRSLPSVNALAFINGYEKRLTGGYQIQVARNGVERVEDVFGLQSAEVSKTGQIITTITPTRRVVDLDLQYALINRQPVSFVVDVNSDVLIGATAYYHRVIFIYPNLTLEGESFNPGTGATNRDESMTMVAGVQTAPFSYDGVTYNNNADAYVSVDSAVATL